MKKPIVLGKYVYVTLPKKDDTKIIVDENTKEALEKALLKDLSKVIIWAVGDAANSKLKEGQSVLVNPSALVGPSAKILTFPDGHRRALVLDYDVVHIWQE